MWPLWMGSNVPPRIPIRRRSGMRLCGRLARCRQSMPHRFDEFGHAGARRAGDAEERELQIGRPLLERRGARRFVKRVDLVRRDHLRLRGKRRLKELQLAPQLLDLARLAGLHFPRRAIGRRREARVAEPAAPAARHEDALSLFGEIGEQAGRRVAVAGLFVHERADRNGELEIRAGLTRAIRALAVCSAVGGKLRMESVVDEGVDLRAGDDEDRSAVSAVAAAGPAARDALLAPEREASAPAISGFDVNVDFVYKQSLCWRLLNRLNADHAAVRAVVLELHAAGDLREDRVVFAEARVEARAEAPPALADDDGAAADEIAVVRFDAEALRVAVAAVA